MDGLNALPHGIKGLKIKPLETVAPQGNDWWPVIFCLILAAMILLLFYLRRKLQRPQSAVSDTAAALSHLSTDDESFSLHLSRLTRLGLYQRYGLDLRSVSGNEVKKIATSALDEQNQADFMQLRNSALDSPKRLSDNQTRGYLDSPESWGSSDSLSKNQSVDRLSRQNADPNEAAEKSDPLLDLRSKSEVSKTYLSSNNFSLKDKINNLFLKGKSEKSPQNAKSSIKIRNLPSAEEISVFFMMLEADLFASKSLDPQQRGDMKKIALKWIEEKQ